MPRELPSTASLRGFVYAARTLSFKRAAAELHVSASALSRQIRSLEDLLGARLFQRLHPGISLTEEGRRYLEAAEAALARLEAAQEQLAPGPRPLRISALESFSERWLIPTSWRWRSGSARIRSRRTQRSPVAATRSWSTRA